MVASALAAAERAMIAESETTASFYAREHPRFVAFQYVYGHLKKRQGESVPPTVLVRRQPHPEDDMYEPYIDELSAIVEKSFLAVLRDADES